jgi:hypothetical protein
VLGLLLVPLLYLLIQPIRPADSSGTTSPPLRPAGASPLATGSEPPLASGPAASPSASATGSPGAGTSPGAVGGPLPTGATTAAQNGSVAGYVLGGSQFTAVRGTWVQPGISCSTVQRRTVSAWVGVDGYASGTAEEVGTASACGGQTGPRTFAWYQLYPHAAVVTPLVVRAGDALQAEVTVAAERFTLSLRDLTTGGAWSTTAVLPTASREAVAWLVDAHPVACGGACSGYTLADFGSLTFTGLSATGNGHPGTLDDPLWSRERITMVDSSGAAKAAPGTLDPQGAAFTVAWLRP